MIYCIRQLSWRWAIAQKLKENCRVNITGVASPSWVQKSAHCLWHYQSKRRKIVGSQLNLGHLTRTLTFFPVFARESDVFWAVSDMRVHSIYRLVRKCKKKKGRLPVLRHLRPTFIRDLWALLEPFTPRGRLQESSAEPHFHSSPSAHHGDQAFWGTRDDTCMAAIKAAPVQVVSDTR